MVAWCAWGQSQNTTSLPALPDSDQMISNYAQQMLTQGKEIFRFDTFGDEAFWGDALRLHQAIAGEKLGGVGPGVSPKTALAVGLKVDLDALPPDWWINSKPVRSISTIQPRLWPCSSSTRWSA